MATSQATFESKTQAQTTDITRALQVGVVSGLVGGSVFGVQMAVGGMLPMVASMIGSQDVVLGFIVHLLISAIIGATYGLIAPRIPAALLVQVGAGVVYGIVWWVLGALIIMPLVLGMGEMVLQVNEMALMSLVGHVIFGLIMGVSFVLLRDKA